MGNFNKKEKKSYRVPLEEPGAALNTKNSASTSSSFDKGAEAWDTFYIENIKNGLVNDEVQCKPKKVPKVPKHLPQLPLLFGGFGVVKSGKTNAFVNLIQEYMDYGSINILYIISPTYHSNASLQTLKVKTENVYTNARTSVQALGEILKKIKDLNDEYLEEKNYRRIYKLFMTGQKSKLKYAEINLLHMEKFRKPEHVEWPKPCIFIDDMTHTELMANTINNALSHLCLHHRHLEGVGVTIVQAFQTFKSGMPKVVRTNLGAILLFPTCNMQEIEEIYKEVANSVTFDTFKQLFFEATKDPHGFLFINKMAKDPAKQFGINYNQTFVVDILKERKKLLKLN